MGQGPRNIFDLMVYGDFMGHCLDKVLSHACRRRCGKPAEGEPPCFCLREDEYWHLVGKAWRKCEKQ